jgi:transposase-like protein
MQRYFCNDCHRKFADNDAVPGMKTPVWIISLALSCYFDGLSLGKIQNEINLRHGAYYAQSSIYNWIVRFSTQAVKQAAAFNPVVSDRWVLCVSPVASGSSQYWFLDIFDIDSQFLLASSLSETGTEADTLNFLESIHLKTRKTHNHPVTIFVPENIVTFEVVSKTNEKVQTKPYWLVRANKSRIEEYSKLLKRRNAVIRNYKNPETSRILIEAWRVHYNFLSETWAGNRIPPAQKADITHLKSWADIISQSRFERKK